MSARVCLVLAVVLFNGCLFEAATPALLVDLTQSGTQKIVDAVFPPLVASFQGYSGIPGDDGSADGFDYRYNNVIVQSVSYNNAVVIFNNDSTIAVNINGLSITVSLDWSYNLHSWPHTPSGRGSADASTNNAAIHMVMRTTAGADGRPVLTVVSSDVGLGDFDITIHGDALSWLYDILVDLFKHSIRDSLSKALNDEMESLVESTASKAFAKLPMKTTLTSQCYLDWSMVGDPYVQQPVMAVPLKGEIYSSSNPTEAPLAHAALAPTPATQMIQFTLDQFLVNSAFWVYFQAGLLHFSLTDAMLPASFPIRLNTTNFAAIVPELAARYPDMLMKFELTASASPDVQFKPNSTILTGYSDVIVSVLANQSYVAVFTLSLNASAAFDLFINDTSYPGSSAVAFRCDSLDVTASIVSSTIGTFDVASLVNFLNMVADGLVLPALNNIVSKGIPLPALDGMTFSNMEIVTALNQLAVNSDLSFSLELAEAQAAERADTEARSAKMDIFASEF